MLKLMFFCGTEDVNLIIKVLHLTSFAWNACTLFSMSITITYIYVYCFIKPKSRNFIKRRHLENEANF